MFQRLIHMRQFAYAALALSLMISSASGMGLQFKKCAPGQPNTADKTCVVDGDTLWLNGENMRLRDVDTPEPQTNICGGEQEKRLAEKASDRLVELLNENSWSVERFGPDNTSSRRELVVIRIRGRDVGDILIQEGLARRWPHGDEWWCD